MVNFFETQCIMICISVENGLNQTILINFNINFNHISQSLKLDSNNFNCLNPILVTDLWT